eukprot:scaffold25742_cov108-Cylindrotheca_fusiformis.AAC.1
MNSSTSNVGQMPQQAIVIDVHVMPRTSFGVDDPMQIKIANSIFIKGEPLFDNDGDKFLSENEEMYSEMR